MQTKSSPDYDLVIIGAGIHGAAVARHAELEGYKVCVIEQEQQPAMATSSRSSKLIHGGLRYLESMQFKLVKECLEERATLLKTAPSLVRLSPFYIPVYRDSKRPAWMIWLGLMLYKLLGGGRFRKVPRQQWSTLDDLHTDQLICVFEYFDGVTDDQRLTQAIIEHAISLGAELKTSTRVMSCQLTDNIVSIELDNQSTITASFLINAAGPWVNQVLANTRPPQPQVAIELVQGTHIVIPRQLKHGVYYFEAADHRVIFAIPWKDQCLLGTTETLFTQPPDTVRPLDTEIDYLLASWNKTFNDQLLPADVLESFAGLRVLPAADGHAFNRSRDTLLVCNNVHQPQIISIVGGKLTAHRITAERVMKLIHSRQPAPTPVDTREIKLSHV